MRSFTWVTCFLLSVIFAQAQKQQYGTIKGTVIDSTGRQPLEAASISVFERSDSSVVGYSVTNRKGEFFLRDIPAEKDLYILISYNGLKTIRKNFRLARDVKELVLENFLMVKSYTELDEILVVAEKPPVVIRNDTVEFNAGSFKTAPNSVVEDLLKQLTGVEVDKDGNITVNGKKVTKVTVDGKEFFAGDPKIATRNLPKDIVDKIQVADN